MTSITLLSWNMTSISISNHVASLHSAISKPHAWVNELFLHNTFTVIIRKRSDALYEIV